MPGTGIFYEQMETIQKSPGNPGFFVFGAKSPVFFISCGLPQQHHIPYHPT